jgi:hypothetical protein
LQQQRLYLIPPLQRNKNQTTAQENARGSGPLLNIFCSNEGSQIQGKDNDVSLSASHPSIATGNGTVGS